ncbi:hypothetical protein DdX_11979 [Ditylenchus destructor]|uniref:EGF-like domain-containing protein n=1 Tax=Ditylenchus destructor TaxID=166010 RepID=A0AAD4N1C6_9BILA|nr:hypothetical protein DdX_11979 [Ditylenchus destructor]
MPDIQFSVQSFSPKSNSTRSVSSSSFPAEHRKNARSHSGLPQINIADEFPQHSVKRFRPFQETGGEPGKVPFIETNAGSKLHDDAKLVKSDDTVTVEGPVVGDVNRKNASTPATITTSQVSSQPPSEAPAKRNGTEIGTVVSRVWENVKKMMGFGADCLNGGHKNLRGDCVCPKYYENERCEKITCANNGTPARSDPLLLYDDICKCPHPEFIYGKHCEMVRCHNGGRDLGNGGCACVDGWYTGQFCQYYTSSWLAAIGLPLLGIALIIICCVVCRLDLCPRRGSRRDRSRRRNHPQPRGITPRSTQSRQNPRSSQIPNDQMRREQMAHEQALVIQENLLNEGVFGQLDGRQFVVRLEQVPTYNPQLWGVTGSNQTESALKPVEPPPSYEQAVRCPSVSTDLLPPDYTPVDNSNLVDQEHQRQNTERISAQNRRPPDSSSRLPR